MSANRTPRQSRAGQSAAQIQDWGRFIFCNTCDGWHYGAGGAAGILLVRRNYNLPGQPATHVVMQHRADDLRTWAIPGGALDYGEMLRQGAIREASEEVSLPLDCTEGDDPLIVIREETTLTDHGYWRYTTFIADVLREFNPTRPAGEAESISVEWVPIDLVGLGRVSPLLPAFRDAWPTLRGIIQRSTIWNQMVNMGGENTDPSTASSYTVSPPLDQERGRILDSDEDSDPSM
ncbi:hypothetical protein N8I77_000520 [Diaporthe amygdali]|uniref:Nudix hydrolase domain-containing protein n=1 Tax=Phomopsis amygdali TaxID=1214568 RepID=A0AAD9SNZ6_PHOAM|nr:hypothetical protein N8I77_000520 [Diaporthe amygdali]